MTLNDILQSAQGGQGLQNLATQFGLSPAQTQAAIQAIIPALSHGLQRSADNPGQLGGIVSEIANGAHNSSYSDPTQTGAAVNASGGALGQIFGSSQMTNQIGQQVSRASGIDPQIIASMMPAVASMVMGGLSHYMNASGHGGVMGQLANAANSPGGLNQEMPNGSDASAASGGGIGGMIGSVLGGLFGGSGGGQSAGMQSGLSTLINMFESGVSAPAGHQQALNDILPR